MASCRTRRSCAFSGGAHSACCGPARAIARLPAPRGRRPRPLLPACSSNHRRSCCTARRPRLRSRRSPSCLRSPGRHWSTFLALACGNSTRHWASMAPESRTMAEMSMPAAAASPTTSQLCCSNMWKTSATMSSICQIRWFCAQSPAFIRGRLPWPTVQVPFGGSSRDATHFWICFSVNGLVMAPCAPAATALSTCGSLASAVIITSGARGARLRRCFSSRKSSPFICGMCTSQRMRSSGRSSVAEFSRAARPSMPLAACSTSARSRPEWRSAPSRILRITGESSMIRTLTLMLFNLASERLSAFQPQA